MSMANEEAMAQVALGIDAEAFVLSPLGKYLAARSESERSQAMERLKDVAPDDDQMIRALQFRIRVAEAIPKWLAECIQAGHNAEFLLREEQN